MSDVIKRLEAVLAERKEWSPDESYTAQLLAAGQDEIVKKIGEEAIEVILAAQGQGDARVVEEAADLVYHLLVLLLARGLSWAEVEAELNRRLGP
jgi:phosphoribosyl-ATP pyrophosphohydrolase